MTRSIGYTNNSPQPNQESSSSKLLLPTTDKRRNIESGGILSPTQTQTLELHHHQFNAQHQQQTQRQGGREPTQDPDQPDLASATTGGASNSNKPPQAQPEANHVAASIRYQECLKNHAASIGGHVVDGCREFMPSGDEGTAEALKCAACECHRNFHRGESQGGESQQLMSSFYHAHNHNGNNGIRTTNHHIQPPSSQQYPHPHPHHHHQFSHHYSHSLASPTTGGPLMMAGRGPAESSSEDLNMFHSNARWAQPMSVPQTFSVSKKRFRTKFSKEQKDRMHEVAEKLGWKIQKQDGEQVQQLCDELGVKRQVFKVWMHNNKQAMKKKQHE